MSRISSSNRAIPFRPDRNALGAGHACVPCPYFFFLELTDATHCATFGTRFQVAQSVSPLTPRRVWRCRCYRGFVTFAPSTTNRSCSLLIRRRTSWMLTWCSIMPPAHLPRMDSRICAPSRRHLAPPNSPSTRLVTTSS